MAGIDSGANQLKQDPETINCRSRDEREWQDIAEEEFEVSSSHSPMSNYAPVFLKQAGA